MLVSSLGDYYVFRNSHDLVLYDEAEDEDLEDDAGEKDIMM